MLHHATNVRIAGRWLNPSLYKVDSTASRLWLPTGNSVGYNPILLENLRLGKFQATFAVTIASGFGNGVASLVFNATRNAFSYVTISHNSTAQNPVGYTVTATGEWYRDAARIGDRGSTV